MQMVKSALMFSRLKNASFFVLENGESSTSSVRAKREGFVDFDAIPTMMRGFAHNLGRGLNNMVQQSQNLGQR